MTDSLSIESEWLQSAPLQAEYYFKTIQQVSAEDGATHYQSNFDSTLKKKNALGSGMKRNVFMDQWVKGKAIGFRHSDVVTPHVSR